MQASLFDVSWASQAFSATECDAIVGRFRDAPLNAGLLMQQSTADVLSRNSAVRFVPLGEPDRWIFDRLRDVAVVANQQLHFDLRGFEEEGFQFARYGEGEFYHWHADLGPDASALRKLSLVVQLTSPDEYDGGALEFFPSPVVAPRDRGTVIIFPAYIPHRVLPVTRGIRHSIAAWICGAAPFR